MPSDDRVDRNFILQQGLPDPGPGSCTILAGALLFQPRVITVIMIVLTLLQSAPGFFGLAVILLWGVVFPSLNLFDAAYRVFARSKPGAAALPMAAPPPRRFAQTVAGTTAALIGLSVIRGWWVAVYALEAFLFVALAALSFGRFCFGSFFYYLLRGKVAFAIRTLPWGPGA